MLSVNNDDRNAVIRQKGHPLQDGLFDSIYFNNYGVSVSTGIVESAAAFSAVSGMPF